jgi:hypothetical protein
MLMSLVALHQSPILNLAVGGTTAGGVGVGAAVGVGVALGVAVGVLLGLGVGVAVGLGAAPADSKAPISQPPPAPRVLPSASREYSLPMS